MNIYIIDKNTEVIVSLRYWHDEDGWSPNVFGDLEVNIPVNHPAKDYDTDADAAMTYAEYLSHMEWWQTEVDAYNAHTENNWFVEGLHDDEIEAEYAKGLEYALDYEEIEDGLTVQEFVEGLYNNCREDAETMDLETAETDLANFRREGCLLPDGITPESYMAAWNELVSDDMRDTMESMVRDWLTDEGYENGTDEDDLEYNGITYRRGDEVLVLDGEPYYSDDVKRWVQDVRDEYGDFYHLVNHNGSIYLQG